MSICPKCGSEFICGITAGDESCWCFSLPKVTPISGQGVCFCPACLKELQKNETTKNTQEK
jgi:hypothetical protein